MKYDKINRTFDCEPTLTDTEVLQFCRDGYLCLQGVVPDEINERTCDYLNGDLPINPCFIPKGITHADLGANAGYTRTELYSAGRLVY